MGNNIKQTAFDWYIEQYNILVLKFDNMPIEERMKRLMDLVDKTKEMEKEQIEDAYWEGGIDIPNNGEQCQQYYNETYGGDK